MLFKIDITLFFKFKQIIYRKLNILRGKIKHIMN